MSPSQWLDGGGIQTGSGSWSCDRPPAGLRSAARLRVCVFHTAQTFSVVSAALAEPLSDADKDSGCAQLFRGQLWNSGAAAAGTAFLSFRIRAAFRILRGPEVVGRRRAVGSRCTAEARDPLRKLYRGARTQRGTPSAMAGVGRKGSGRPSYYYRFLGKSRLQRQRSRSRSRSRTAGNRGKASAHGSGSPS